MKQNNNNVSDFPGKIGSVDRPDTQIIIKRGIRHVEAILRVQQQQQQQQQLLFIVYLMYVIVVAHTQT